MANWKNLDTLASFDDLAKVEKVNLVQAMSGENGAKRVKTYSVPMAEGLAYNYAAKQVDDDVIDALVTLAGSRIIRKIRRIIQWCSHQYRREPIGTSSVDQRTAW